MDIGYYAYGRFLPKHSTYGIVTKQSIIYESHEQRIAYR